MRLRKTDSLLAIGLVVILLWTPAFVAQSEDAREHAAARSFQLPPIREGTQVEFDLVVHVEGADPLVIPGFASAEFRRATDDEAAEGAVAVQERAFHALHHEVDLGGDARFTLKLSPRATKTGYDAHGDPAIAWETGRHDRNQSVAYSATYRPSQELGVVRPGTVVNYVPDPASALVHNSAASIRAYLIENHDFPDPTASVIAAYNGRVLYGDTHPLSRLFEFDGHFGQFESERLHPWPLRIEAVGERAMERTYPGIDWYAEDAPIPVGNRWIVKEKDGDRTATIDVVPGLLRQGTGTVLQIRPTFAAYGWRDGLDQAPDAMRVGDLMHDERPLYGSVSLAWLTAEVGTSGPPEVRDALRQGAFLAGFSWTESMPAAAHGVPDVPPVVAKKARPAAAPPLPVADETPLVSDWTLDFVLGDQRLVVEAHIEERDAPVARFSLGDTCTRTPGALVTACYAQPPDALVADPVARVEAARAAGMTPRPGANVTFLFIATTSGLIDPPWWRTAGLLHLPFVHGQVYAEQSGENGAHFMIWDAETGVLVANLNAYPEDDGTRPLMASASATAVQAHDAVGYTAAGAGLLLAVAGMLPRLLGWLRFGTGGMFMAGLYAKIARNAVLDNERRSEIVSAVEQDPGLSTSDISKRFGYGWGATLHHLGTLERNGLLSSMTLPGGRHWFVADVPPRERVRTIAMRHGPSAQLLQEIATRPGATLTEIIESAGVSKSVGSKAGKRLANLGLVEKRREGRATRYFPAS